MSSDAINFINRFKEIFDNILMKSGLFLNDIKDLKESYKRIVGFNNLIRINNNFYIWKLFPKKYPNLTIDLRIRLIESRTDQTTENESRALSKFSMIKNKKMNKFLLCYFVLPGMYSGEIEENSFIYDIEDKKIYGEDVIQNTLKKIEEIISGKKYLNCVDIGTYDLFTFAEYYPSPLILNTYKYVYVKIAYTPDLISFRRTDLFYNIDKVIEELLLLNNTEQREKFINELKDVISYVTKKIVLIYSDILFKEIASNGRVLNITVPPHLESDIKRTARILIDGYSKNDNIQLNKNINVARFYVDKFLSYHFINQVYKNLKNYLTNVKALFTVTYDINYFVFWNDLNFLVNNVSSDSDDAIITNKCFDSLNIVNLKTKDTKCIHRQTFDSVKFLMNDNLKEMIKKYLIEDNGDDYVSDKNYRYSHKFIKMSYLPVSAPDVIKAYYDISKYISPVR